MNIYAFIIFLFCLQGICFFIGKKSSRNIGREDYFLGGKGIAFFPLMMTFLATQVGGGLVLGSAEEAYRYGFAVVFYPLGAALGLLALGLGLGARMAQFKIKTVAEIFEVVYKAPYLKKFASLLSIVSLFMIFVAQVIASHKFMISFGIDSSFWFFAFWGLAAAYTTLGGLKAVIATDIIQASFFSTAFLVCFGYAFFQNPLPETFFQGDFTLETSKIMGWLSMPLLFMVIEQDMGQRCLAGATPQTVSHATLVAGILTMLLCSIPVFFGIMAKELGLTVPEGSSILMIALQNTTSPFLTAWMAAAILAAILSTADSLINAISSNITEDFSFMKDSRLSTCQSLTAAIALTGIFASFYFNNVVDLLIQSYELSVSCLFIPIFIALFKKQGKASSALISIIFGFSGFLLFKYHPPMIPKELASVFLSLIGFGVGEALFFAKALRKFIPWTRIREWKENDIMDF